MSGRMSGHEILLQSCEENVKNKLSICKEFSKILLDSLLLGDERPDFTGMESKTTRAPSATWSCNATDMVALDIEIHET